MNIYLAGPMSGVPYFNFPAFNAAAEKLRTEYPHAGLFNPASRDVERVGYDFSPEFDTGNASEAASKIGLSIRECMQDDLTWICQNATHIALLPGWEYSKGAVTEHALARTLGLEFIYLGN